VPAHGRDHAMHKSPEYDYIIVETSTVDQLLRCTLHGSAFMINYQINAQLNNMITVLRASDYYIVTI
jgi:hypothetical protein